MEVESHAFKPILWLYVIVQIREKWKIHTIILIFKNIQLFAIIHGSSLYLKTNGEQS